MNDWFPARNRSGQWCACTRDGCMDACESHEAALALCDKRNAAELAEDALADLTQNTDPRAGAPNDLR